MPILALDIAQAQHEEYHQRRLVNMTRQYTWVFSKQHKNTKNNNEFAWYVKEGQYFCQAKVLGDFKSDGTPKYKAYVLTEDEYDGHYVCIGTHCDLPEAKAAIESCLTQNTTSQTNHV